MSNLQNARKQPAWVEKPPGTKMDFNTYAEYAIKILKSIRLQCLIKWSIFKLDTKYLFQVSFTARAPGSTSDATALKAGKARQQFMSAYKAGKIYQY